MEARNAKLDLYLRSNTKCLSNGESAQRAYLLTGADKYYEIYKLNLEDWKKNEMYYDSLPVEAKRNEVRDIQEISKKKLALASLTLQLYDSNQKDSAINIVNSGYGQVMMDSLRAQSTSLRNELSRESATERERERRLLYVFFILVIVLIALSLLIAWFTYRAFNTYTQSLEKTVAALEKAHGTMLQYHLQVYKAIQKPMEDISGVAQLLEQKGKTDSDAESKQYANFLTDGVRQLGSIIVEMRSKYLEQNGDGPKPAP